MPTITQKIDNIIDRRIGRGDYEGFGHLQVIREKQFFFGELINFLNEYRSLRDNILFQIDNSSGEYYTMSIEDPTFRQKIELADPLPVISQLQKCQKECVCLEKRFNRETINISVVGRAGQGKSRLLQSISGVPNDIIPADTGGDCTGAKSTIANNKGKMHAKIKFYTEQEIVTQVQAYINALEINIPPVGSITQVQHINLKKIKEECPRMTSKQDSLFRHLSRYVEHYDKYGELLGNEIDENDPQKIRYYVAQYATGNPKERYYAYLGVKEVTIYTEFPEKDAGKIQLVDTIGLGDTSLNLEDKMLETIGNDSDAAIVVRKADPEREHVSNEDNEFYDYIVQSFGDRDVEKWLFYALNVCEALHNTVTGEELYERFKEKQKDGSLRVALLEKVDCGSQEDVRNKLLIPMLDFIANNLTDIDNNLMSHINEVFISTFQQYYELCDKLTNILNSKFKQSLKSGGLFDQLYTKELKLSQRLEELNMRYANHKQACEDIRVEILKVLRSLKNLCPQQEIIKERLSRGDVMAHPHIVYSNMADFTRAEISDQFEEINQTTITRLQEDVKLQIIEIIKSDEGGKLGRIPTNIDIDNPTPQEWMGAFIDQHLDNYPLIKAAFENILNYRLNIEGLLEYRVNISIEHLEPESPEFEQITFGTNREQNAIDIRQAILRAIPKIGENLNSNIEDVLMIPYSSFYARIKKFRERIIYSEDGGQELKEFYREKAALIWHERFSAVISKQEALESLHKISEELGSKRIKKLFTITIK